VNFEIKMFLPEFFDSQLETTVENFDGHPDGSTGYGGCGNLPALT
jgi:hypothetical protein